MELYFNILKVKWSWQANYLKERLKSGKYDIPKVYHEIPKIQIELDFIAECKNYYYFQSFISFITSSLCDLNHYLRIALLLVEQIIQSIELKCTVWQREVMRRNMIEVKSNRKYCLILEVKVLKCMAHFAMAERAF